VNPEGEIARLTLQLADQQALTCLMVGLSLGLAVLFWWVDRLREAGCAQCAHCIRRAKGNDKVAQATAQEARERLFGSEVQASEGEPDPSREDGASGDQHGGEGPKD
jgi:hypothetical protein